MSFLSTHTYVHVHVHVSGRASPPAPLIINNEAETNNRTAYPIPCGDMADALINKPLALKE